MTRRSAPPFSRRTRSLVPTLCAVLGLLMPSLVLADPYGPQSGVAGKNSAADAATAALPVPGDRRAAVVTATAGEPTSTLTRGSTVNDNQPVSTGVAENLALVLEDDALLELCARSIVTLRRHAVRKAQIVKLDAGEARFVVSPRTPDQRIEVHTPSAIATILGTVVMVKVDPVTGETTVTSEENQVEVRSSDPSIPGAVKVSEGEQCVVPTGGAPAEAKKVPEEEFATLGDCLLDLENSALAKDRIARRRKDLEKLAMTDMGELDLPLVATLGELGPDLPTDPQAPTEVLDPISRFTGEEPEMPVVPPVDIPIPPPCIGLACNPGPGG